MSELRKEMRDGQKVWFSPSGKELISVTQVIQEASLMTYRSSPIDNPWVERGTKVHHCVEAFNNRVDPAEGDLTEETAGYLLAYQKFLQESGFKLLDQEKRVWNENLGACGQYDLRGRFPKVRKLAIVDIKTGRPAKWHHVQTGGYALLTDPEYDRYSLYLAGDGTYKLSRHEDPNDLAVFKACLTVALWKRANGVKGRSQIIKERTCRTFRFQRSLEPS